MTPQSTRIVRSVVSLLLLGFPGVARLAAHPDVFRQPDAKSLASQRAPEPPASVTPASDRQP